MLAECTPLGLPIVLRCAPCCVVGSLIWIGKAVTIAGDLKSLLFSNFRSGLRNLEQVGAV